MMKGTTVSRLLILTMLLSVLASVPLAASVLAAGETSGVSVGSDKSTYELGDLAVFTIEIAVDAPNLNTLDIEISFSDPSVGGTQTRTGENTFEYLTGPLYTPGLHTLIVTIYDKATKARIGELQAKRRLDEALLKEFQEARDERPDKAQGLDEVIERVQGRIKAIDEELDEIIVPLAEGQRTIRVLAPNSPPSIVSTPVTSGTVGEPYSYDVQAQDPDGESLTFALDAAPAGMSIDPATGLVQWTPASDQVGEHAVTVSVADPRGGKATQSFSVDVTAVVPHVKGLAQAEAEAAVAAAGLTVRSLTLARSETVPEGHVIDVFPEAGTAVPPGSGVDLVISGGPAERTVPDLKGLSQPEAEAAIVAAGLTVGTTYRRRPASRRKAA